jgi:glycosyltransferase involved in cell wall biosynthesis
VLPLNLSRVLPAPLKSVVRPLYYALAGSYYSLASRRAYARGADKRRVAIVCPLLLPGTDAVSNDALGMRDALASEGLQVDLFVATRHPEARFPVSTISGRLAGYGLVIYHYMASIPQLAAILRWPQNVILKYHNITPGHFFDGYSDEYRKECDSARADLPRLLRILPNARALADSEFNRGELLAMGMQEARAKVVPPFHQIDRLLQLRPSAMRAGNDILAVGRVAPNKGLDTMLEAFAQVAKVSNATRLHIVSQNRLGDKVIFHGSVSQQALAEIYAACACFWTCSLHEGFCVPVVEAMAFGKPVVSTRATALPDTCGDSAIFGDTREQMAEALRALLSQPQLREDLGRRARKRYEEEFAIERIAQRFKSAIAPHLSRLSS